MEPTPFDFGDGIVTYSSYEVDEHTPFHLQEFELRQDLIQVEFPEQKVVLDVGWYPELCPEGHFAVFVVQDHDWESPLLLLEARDVPSLRAAIADAVKFINSRKA
jgi:hypothetical protein